MSEYRNLAKKLVRTHQRQSIISTVYTLYSTDIICTVVDMMYICTIYTSPLPVHN